MATASEALRIWSKEGELIISRESDDLLWRVDWSDDGQGIVTSSESGKIIIWDKNANIIQELDLSK